MKVSGAGACRIGLHGPTGAGGFTGLIGNVLRRELLARLPSALVVSDPAPEQLAGTGLDCLVVASRTLDPDPGALGAASCSAWLGVGVPEGLDPAQADLLRTAADRQGFISTGDDASRERLLALGVHHPVAVTPDPVILAPRCHGPELLAKRLDFLRLVGWYPAAVAPLLVETSRERSPDLDVLTEALAGLSAARPELSMVLAGFGSGDDEACAAELYLALSAARPGLDLFRIGAVAGVEDHHAALAACGAFAGACPQALALAAVHDRPTVRLDATGAGAAELRTALMTALDSRRPAGALAGSIAELDAALDQVARVAAGSPARPGPDPGSLVADLEVQLAQLDAAHQARSRRMATERMVFANHLHQAEGEIGRLKQEVARMQSEVALAAEQVARAEARAEAEAGQRAEIEAELIGLRATRTFRYTAELRTAYSRLRQIGLPGEDGEAPRNRP